MVWKQRAARAGVAMAAVASLVGALSAPAFAGGPDFEETTGSTVNVSGTYQPLVGDFCDDGKDDIFWYAPGSGAESLWCGSGSSQGPFQKQAGKPVNGTYKPIVGNFGGSDRTDILWYAPGSAADTLWIGLGGGAFEAHSVSITGTFTPLVLHAEGDYDSIFWYAPGTAADSLWQFTSGATKKYAETVNGTFTPLAGDFDSDGRGDIFWYNPNGADYRWDRNSFATGAFTSISQSIGSGYKGYVGQFSYGQPATDKRDDIVWVRPNGSDILAQGNATGFSTVSVNVPDGASTTMVRQYEQDALMVRHADGVVDLWFLDGNISEGLEDTPSTIAADAKPIAGHFWLEQNGSVLWYRPGSGAEKFWFLD